MVNSHFYRCHVLVFPILISILLCYAHLSPASAGPYSPQSQSLDDEGGGEHDGTQQITRKKNIEMGADKFLRLYPYEIRKLSGYYKTGSRITIHPFSWAMSSWLLHMAVNDRRATQRLVREMSKIKDPKKRAARLQQELRRVKDFRKNLEASAKRFEEKKMYGAENEERRRLRRLNKYAEGLEVWIKYPHEGAPKSSTR